MKLNDFFTIQEFVPPEIYNDKRLVPTWFIQKDVVDGITFIRQTLDVRIRANNWATVKGGMQNRGYRVKQVGDATLSQHFLANAIDFDSPDMTVAEIYKWLMDNQDLILAKTAFMAIEDLSLTNKSGDGWIHLDKRFIPNAKGLMVVK